MRLIPLLLGLPATLALPKNDIFLDKPSSSSILSRPKRWGRSNYLLDCIKKACNYEDYKEYWENHVEWEVIPQMYGQYSKCKSEFDTLPVLQNNIGSDQDKANIIQFLDNYGPDNKERIADVSGSSYLYGPDATATNILKNVSPDSVQFYQKSWELFMLRCAPQRGNVPAFLNMFQAQKDCTCDKTGSTSVYCDYIGSDGNQDSCSCIKGVTGKTCKDMEPGFCYPAANDFSFEFEDHAVGLENSDNSWFPEKFTKKADADETFGPNSGYVDIGPGTSRIVTLDFDVPAINQGQEHSIFIPYANEGDEKVMARVSVLVPGKINGALINDKSREQFFVNFFPTGQGKSATQGYHTNIKFNEGVTQAQVKIEWKRGAPSLLVDRVDFVPVFYKKAEVLSSADRQKWNKSCGANGWISTSPWMREGGFCHGAYRSLAFDFHGGAKECDCSEVGTEKCEAFGCGCVCKQGYGGKKCENQI